MENNSQLQFDYEDKEQIRSGIRVKWYPRTARIIIWGVVEEVGEGWAIVKLQHGGGVKKISLSDLRINNDHVGV